MASSRSIVEFILNERISGAYVHGWHTRSVLCALYARLFCFLHAIGALIPGTLSSPIPCVLGALYAHDVCEHGVIYSLSCINMKRSYLFDNMIGLVGNYMYQLAPLTVR